METYPIGLVPGPVSVPKEIRGVYFADFGSADLESEFFGLYGEVQSLLQQILYTRATPVVMSGEGMLALWGALKSALFPGERVLAVANGVFGYGVADMAKAMGQEVEVVGFGYDEGIDFDLVRRKALSFRPSMITAVHCETPSGILNPIKPLGEIAHKVGALLYVDFVSSAGGTEVRVDDWHIDLGLLGSQKALSLLPELAIVTVSDRAWEAIEKRRYVGYDAILPFKDALTVKEFPYTHNWHAIAALKASIKAILSEGLENVFKRHDDVAAYCRDRLKGMGVSLFPKDESLSSPTVTAAKVPEGWTWIALDTEMRRRGVVFGGSYGPLKGKVFRIGHMGSQARLERVEKAMDALEEVLADRP
ncbi:MAG TPA: aminotransferase class V-fold PLP-dependent enzyme [Thermosynergistes sp.]|nr:aminotransferase class V-fold PLP-dependent enzyme [Thermosynergistes sp.]